MGYHPTPRWYHHSMPDSTEVMCGTTVAMYGTSRRVLRAGTSMRPTTERSEIKLPLIAVDLGQIRTTLSVPFAPGMQVSVYQIAGYGPTAALRHVQY
eukprot:3940561-Rhodomonas_salina.2